LNDKAQRLSNKEKGKNRFVRVEVFSVVVVAHFKNEQPQIDTKKKIYHIFILQVQFF